MAAATGPVAPRKPHRQPPLRPSPARAVPPTRPLLRTAGSSRTSGLSSPTRAGAASSGPRPQRAAARPQALSGLLRLPRLRVLHVLLSLPRPGRKRGLRRAPPPPKLHLHNSSNKSRARKPPRPNRVRTRVRALRRKLRLLRQSLLLLLPPPCATSRISALPQPLPRSPRRRTRRHKPPLCSRKSRVLPEPRPRKPRPQPRRRRLLVRKRNVQVLPDLPPCNPRR